MFSVHVVIISGGNMSGGISRSLLGYPGVSWDILESPGNPGWDSNPRHTANEADALPTKLRTYLSWLGRIKAIQDKGNQSNLT